MNQAARLLPELLYRYASCYPCALLCYLILIDKQTQSPRRIAAALAVVCIPVAALPAALSGYFGIGDTASLIMAVFMTGCFLHCRRIAREGVHKLLFAFFLVINMAYTISDLECAVRSLTGNSAFFGRYGSAADLYFFILLHLTAYLVIWRLINRFIIPRLKCVKSEDMRGLWILPLALTAVSVCRVSTYVHDSAYGIIFPLLTLCFAVLSLFVYSLILRLIDITITRTILEEETRRKELLSKTKEEFLQDMWHEMKTPVAVIATGIDFADQEIKSGDASIVEAGIALGTIRAETQRLGRMIDSMASFGVLDEAGKNRRPVDCSELLRQSAEKFRYALERQSTTLDIELAPDMPEVFVEADGLAQVVSNLMANAARHTKNGRVTVAADYDDEYVVVRVSDTGEGVPPDILTRVFERGVSGCDSTGYGLYICKAVVESHGGTIKLESELGRGCSVTFAVPIHGSQGAVHGL